MKSFFMQTHPAQSQDGGGLSPFAIILACMDPRVPVEILFDQGVGDVVVVRGAGGIATPHVIASLEFAVATFHPPLCVVMGHTDCRAVKAVISAAVDPSPRSGESFVEAFLPFVRGAIETMTGRPTQEKISNSGMEGPWMEEAAWVFVHDGCRRLSEESSLIRKAVDQEEITIVGAMYDVNTGRATFAPEKKG